MAIVNTKSIIVQNYDSLPRVMTPSYLAGANDTTGTAVVPIAATDWNGSVYHLAIISSGVVLASLNIMNDAMINGIPVSTVFKFGVTNLTQVNSGGLPVLYADQIFASNVSMGSARSIMTPILQPAILNGTPAVANVTLRVWELLGFTQDPMVDYHLIATPFINAAVAGNLAVQFSWLR